MLDPKSLPKGAAFTLISVNDPKGSIIEKGDPATLRKNKSKRAKVGDVKQVTAYKLGDKTHFSGEVISLKLDPNKADSRVRWIKTELNPDNLAAIKLEKKRQKMNDTVMRVKAFRKSLLSLPVGLDTDEKESLSGEVAMLIDWCKTHISEAFDILSGADVVDTTPKF